MTAPIRLHIDRLVLDGIALGPGDADRFQAALVETLGELLRVEGVGAASPSALGGRGHPRAPGPSVMAGLDPAMTEGGAGTESTTRHGNLPAIATGASPTALGQAVARAVHASLTTLPRNGGRT